MNGLRLVLGLDDPIRWQAFSLAVWFFVALVVLYNILFTLPGLLAESFAWIEQALRVPRTYSVRRVVSIASRMKRAAAAPPPDVVAVSERERLNVVVRMSDRRGSVRL
jgi:hypothetical protein